MQMMAVGSLEVELHRKAIKNLHLSVLPPAGRVRVAAPEQMSDTAIRLAIIAKLAWIKTKQAEFLQQPRQSQRQFESGECHYVWGRRLRLSLLSPIDRVGVRVAGSRLQMHISNTADRTARERLLMTFYRASLKEEVTKLLPIWQSRLGLADHSIGFAIRQMKTKWGSCNPATGRVLLNLELAKKPPSCLEYIVVHELLHMLERHHNDRFATLLDQHLPDWRERKALLNVQPLSV